MEEQGSVEDGAASVAKVAFQTVTPRSEGNPPPGPVLHPQRSREGVGQRIREVAQIPDVGGYRKIAEFLQAEGIQVSHMKVKRVLAKGLAGVA